MRSLPVPKKQEGPVNKIVSNNYDEIIHRVKKDAVMYFYAPWCGHCKEFDPVFKKVAKKIFNLIITRIVYIYDSNLNQVIDHGVWWINVAM